MTVVLEMDDRTMMNALYGGTYTNSQSQSHVEKIKKGHSTHASERLHTEYKHSAYYLRT